MKVDESVASDVRAPAASLTEASGFMLLKSMIDMHHPDDFAALDVMDCAEQSFFLVVLRKAIDILEAWNITTVFDMVCFT